MRYRTPEALGMAVTAAARRSGMDVGRAISGFYFHREEVSDLVASIIERDGSLAASELAKAGGVSVRTAQRRIRRMAEGGELEVSARDPPSVRAARHGSG